MFFTRTTSNGIGNCLERDSKNKIEGFAESSGQPLPSQILNAVDAVMQYAVERLGFREDDIIIYAWSIGGFPGTWAAANYPDIKVRMSSSHARVGND